MKLKNKLKILTLFLPLLTSCAEVNFNDHFQKFDDANTSYKFVPEIITGGAVLAGTSDLNMIRYSNYKIDLSDYRFFTFDNSIYYNTFLSCDIALKDNMTGKELDKVTINNTKECYQLSNSFVIFSRNEGSILNDIKPKTFLKYELTLYHPESTQFVAEEVAYNNARAKVNQDNLKTWYEKFFTWFEGVINNV